jgi:hypothetical protein
VDGISPGNRSPLRIGRDDEDHARVVAIDLGRPEARTWQRARGADRARRCAAAPPRVPVHETATGRAAGYAYPVALSCTSETFFMLAGVQGDDYEYDGTRWVQRGFTGYHPVALSCASSLCVEVFLERMSREWRGVQCIDGYRGATTDVTCLHVTYCVAGEAQGFYVWNHGTWSSPIARGNLLNAWVACTSERRCLGTQDDGADMWGYRFDLDTVTIGH